MNLPHPPMSAYHPQVDESDNPVVVLGVLIADSS